MSVVYVISYDSEYLASHKVKTQAVHVFTKLEDARKYYLQTIVAPFLKKNKAKDYLVLIH